LLSPKIPTKKHNTAGKNFSKVPPKKYKGKEEKINADARSQQNI
jgi:hypothetical protein